ncbi:MAG: hypothetical protein KDA42_08260 [Planctomycetales bacterium]|nr:hypothetical protein [Planctomycetales bacterium]
MKSSLFVLLLAAVMSVGCAGNRHACTSCGQVGGCDAGCDGGGCADGSCSLGGCADGSCNVGHGGLRDAAMARRQKLAAQRGPAMEPGPAAATVAYPYYTTRAPRDFLMDNPPSIGR